jgi:hypothetical protein
VRQRTLLDHDFARNLPTHRMPRSFFIQKSRLGRAIFEVTEDAVLRSSRLFGVRDETSVPLRALNPEPQHRGVRYTWVIVISGIIAAVSVVAVRVAWLAPEGLSTGLSTYPFFFLGIALITAIRFTPRVHFVEFHDHWGHCRISIVREPHQAEECDAFVTALAARIKLANIDLSEAERQELLRASVGHEASTNLSRCSLKAKLSVILGLTAALFPVTPVISTLFAEFMLPITILGSTAAITCAALVILNRERGRWLALVGLIAGVIPLIFYS